MQVKTVVIALLSATAAVDASVLRGREFGLAPRQGFGGGGFGGGFGGGGFGGQGGGNGGNNGGNQNNGGNNGGNQNQGNQNQGNQNQGNQNNGGNNNQGNQNNANQNNGGNNNNGGNGGTTLSQNAIQTGSAQDGSKGASDGQAKSKTDNGNFINFCAGKTLTNGIQQKQGSCNGIPMGDMPAQAKMVSTVITSPVTGKEPAANKDFNVTVQIANMDLGTFTNPDSTYYSAPQQLSSSGTVIGHTHITIQDMGNSQNPSTPPDASKFAFFKGINDAGNGKGTLTTAVTGGLPAGNYRICTMAGSSNHQPVLMPVAQRGAQDDCMRITISNNGGNQNNGGNNGGNQNNGGNGGNNGGNNKNGKNGKN